MRFNAGVLTGRTHPASRKMAMDERRSLSVGESVIEEIILPP